MGRGFGVPIDVWTRAGRPVRFAWRGRIYLVRHVLDHWVALRAVWHATAEAAVPRQEFWRVEAAGVEAGGGVYELRYDSATDTWLLARVLG